MPDLLTAKALREKRAPLAAEIRRQADLVNAENRDFKAEERAAWEKVNKDYDDLTRQIQIAERADTVTQDQDRRATDPVGREDSDRRKRRKKGGGGDGATVTEEHRALALQAWVRTQEGLGLKARHVEACRLVGLNPRKRDLPIRLDNDYDQVRDRCWTAAAMRAARALGREQRTLSAQIPGSGAYTIPTGFVNNLETALLAYAQLRGVCDVMRTEGGEDLPWPSANDTSNKGALLAENTAAATNVDPTFAQSVVLHAYKYTSRIVLVPAELMEDSAFNLANWLGDVLGIRRGRIEADHFTTGTGSSQPTGIVTAATLGITAASSTAIAADELYALKHSVDPAYRTGASWMFHDQVLLYIKKLKDGIGRYLWQSSLALGAPDTLDGDPITINQSMASSVATTNKTVLYGQMKKYKIRDVSTVRMRRLMERYADADQEGFVLFWRTDGNLLDAGTHPVKYLKQP